MKIKKLLMTILVYLLTSVFISSKVFCDGLTPNENGVIPITSENQYQETKYYKESKDSPFGIIGGFHLVGFNSVQTSKHTNGNILTKLLKYESNFGTKNFEEISYIEQLDFEGDGFSYGYDDTQSINSILVIGSEIPVTIDGEDWRFGRSKLDSPRPYVYDGSGKKVFSGRIWQEIVTTDGAVKFIDLADEERKAIELNQQLSKYENKNTEANFRDQNNQYIKIGNTEGLNVYNIEPAKDKENRSGFNFGTPIECRGFEHNKNASLLINVDLAGYYVDDWSSGQPVPVKRFIIPKSLINYGENDYAPHDEVTKWQEGNVVWNFYDSSESDGCYRGEIKNEGAVTGIILAPKATVNIGQNLNGTVVANDIIVGAESHRTDFTGTTLDDPSGDEDFLNPETSIEVKFEPEDEESSPVEITLMENDTPKETVELNEGNNWTHEFENLPKKDEQDKTIEYSVKLGQGSLNDYTQKKVKNKDGSYEIIFKKQEKIKVQVTKKWFGDPNQKPDNIKIHLKTDEGEVKYKELSKNEENEKGEWEYTFDGLDKYKNAEEIKYEITEDEITGYTIIISGKQEEGFVTKNISDEKIDISVKKIFEGKELDSVKIELFRKDKSLPLQTIELKKDKGYQDAFTELRKYDENDGHEIEYSIREVEPEGYDVLLDGDKKNGFVITNKEKNKDDDDGDKGEGKDGEDDEKKDKDKKDEDKDESNKNETPGNSSFTSINNGNEEKSVIVIQNGENEFENKDLYSINSDSSSDFSHNFISETEKNNYDYKSWKSEKDVGFDFNLTPSGLKSEFENGIKELPKTGDGVNINLYLKIIFASGVLLFWFGLVNLLNKKYD